MRGVSCVAAILCAVSLIGFVVSPPSSISQRNTNGNDDTDWRKKGVVSPVKDEGIHCSMASKIFAAVDSIESAYSILTNRSIELSVQQVIDCLPNACTKADIKTTLLYVLRTADGLEWEQSYPYTGVPRKCQFNSMHIALRIAGFLVPSDYTEEHMRIDIGYFGPAATTIDASHESFRIYESGVYFEPQCNRAARNHGVLVVGYGTDPDQGDYWILKNSWGESWGEAGYMRMARNRGDPCGLTAETFFTSIVNAAI